MPHVVTEETCDLGIACQHLHTTVRNGNGILKVVDVYLNRSSHGRHVRQVLCQSRWPYRSAVESMVGPRGPIGATRRHTVQHRTAKNPYVLARRRGFDSR